MAREPEDLVLRLLTQIQATLSDHTKRFERIERRRDDVQESAVTALGLAGHADVRHESVQTRLEELEGRIEELRGPMERLEEKV